MNDQRLRVLLLTNTVPPYRLPLFEALGKQFDLTVLSGRQKESGRLWATSLDSQTVSYRQLTSRTWQPLGTGPVWIRNPDLGNYLRNHLFDVYIAGENLPHALSVITVQRKARQLNKPFILWSGAIDTPYAHGNWFTNLYRRWLYGRTDAFVAYGEKAKNYLVQRGASPKNIVAGTQVVAPGWLFDVPRDKGFLGLAGKTVILYVGYLVPRKGVATLIRAYQQARQSDTVLVIVGEGNQRAALEAIADNEPDIHFTGYLTGEKKWRFYAAADLFVLPTYHDPWAQVIIEAMYFGLPIITTDRDGSADEAIKGNGIVIEAGHVPTLAQAISQLINDPSQRRQMGTRSREIIATYDLEKACHCFLKAIAQVTTNDKGKTS